MRRSVAAVAFALISPLLPTSPEAPAAQAGLFAVDTKQPSSSIFWGSSANVSRHEGRDFFGPAVANDGGVYPYTNLDWFDALQGQSFNGGDGCCGDGNYSQVFILQDPTPFLKLAIPSIALTTAAESVGMPSGATPRALNTFMINNPSAGDSPSGWAIYAEGHLATPSAGETFVGEFEIRNSAVAPSGSWTPYYYPSPGAVGLAIGAGAGLSPKGQYNANVAIYIEPNPMSFTTGIDFLHNAICACGPNGSSPAIVMDYSDALQWYLANGKLGAQIASNQYGDLSLTSGPNADIVLGGRLRLSTVAVALLPRGTRGDIMAVNDATSCIVGAAPSGGGSTFCVVVYTNSAWRELGE